MKSNFFEKILLKMTSLEEFDLKAEKLVCETLAAFLSSGSQSSNPRVREIWGEKIRLLMVGQEWPDQSEMKQKLTQLLWKEKFPEIPFYQFEDFCQGQGQAKG